MCTADNGVTQPVERTTRIQVRRESYQMSSQIYFSELLSEKYISHNPQLHQARRRRISSRSKKQKLFPFEMILGLTNWRLSCQKSFYNYLNAPIHIYQQKVTNFW